MFGRGALKPEDRGACAARGSSPGRRQSRGPSRCTSTRNERVASTGASGRRGATGAGRGGARARTAATVATPAANDVAATAAACLTTRPAAASARSIARASLGQDRDGVDLFDAVGSSSASIGAIIAAAPDAASTEG